MDGTQVPLWTLIVTTITAIVGPVVATVVTNRYAYKMQRSQQGHEQDTEALRAKKQVYAEALAHFYRYQTTATSLVWQRSALIDEIIRVHKVQADLLTHGSLSVAEVGKIVSTNAMILLGLSHKVDPDDAEGTKELNKAYDEFVVAMTVFTATLRIDLGLQPTEALEYGTKIKGREAAE